MKHIQKLDSKLALSRRVTHASYALMLLLLIGNGFVSATPWVIILFSLLPLLIFLYPLRKESYKGLSLLCFVVLMYFMVTVVNLFSPLVNWIHWLQLLTECTLFISAMLFSRWKQYSLYQNTAGESARCLQKT